MNDEERVRKVRTPLFPLYSEVRTLLPIWDGSPKEDILSMINEVREHTGTPQNPVDWSDPDRWIEERLTGERRKFAKAIWEGSKGKVNPRHVYGSYLFIYGFDLLERNSDGKYRLSERGKAFLQDDPAVVREIDEFEGFPELLSILSTKSDAKRADLLPEWGEFLRTYSRYGTGSTIKDTLRRRLLNAVERGLALRDGNRYSLGPKGAGYIVDTLESAIEPRNDVLRAIRDYNTEQTALLRERLGEMSPQRFEQLVGDLLEAMGYEDVSVVGQAGDRGIDVVGTVQVGITSIKEVVQVKRHKNTINRKVVDQLRGALPYHQAIRGTLITLSRFSSGCAAAALFPNAAPITLIDGDRLIKLLVENEIAVNRREAYLTEIDEDYFAIADNVTLDSLEEESNA